MQQEQAAAYQGNLLVFQQYNQSQHNAQEIHSITRINSSTNNNSNMHLSPNFLAASNSQIPFQPWSLCESSGKMSIENETSNHGHQKLEYSPMESSDPNTLGQSEDCISLEKSFEKSPIFQKLAFVFTLDIVDDKQDNLVRNNQFQHQLNEQDSNSKNMLERQGQSTLGFQQQQNINQIFLSNLNSQNTNRINDMSSHQGATNVHINTNQVQNTLFLRQQPDNTKQNQNQSLQSGEIPVNTYHQNQQINSNQSQLEEMTDHQHFEKSHRKKRKNNEEQPLQNEQHYINHHIVYNNSFQPGSQHISQNQSTNLNSQQQSQSEFLQQPQNNPLNLTYVHNYNTNPQIPQIYQQNVQNIQQNINKSNLILSKSPQNGQQTSPSNSSLIIQNNSPPITNNQFNFSSQQNESISTQQFNQMYNQNGQSTNSSLNESKERSNQSIFEKLKEKSNNHISCQQNEQFGSIHELQMQQNYIQQQQEVRYDEQKQEQNCYEQEESHNYDDQTLPIQERNIYNQVLNDDTHGGCYSANQSVSSNANNTKSYISSQDDIDDLLNLDGISLNEFPNPQNESENQINNQ